MQHPLSDAQNPLRPMRPGNQPISRRQTRAETVGPMLEFGRFRVALRQRQLLADDVPVELGTRAFDLLLVLLEADGSLVTKEDLLDRVWPGVVVSEENLKVQISALRKTLGADRDLIRTEFGRGYRFTGVLRSNAAHNLCRGAMRPRPHPARRPLAQRCRRPFRGWCALRLS